MGKPKSCIKTGRYPKAMRATKGQISELITDPGLKEVYRQTINRKTGEWYFPKALKKNGKWRYIRKSKHVIGRHKDGRKSYMFTLWRIWDLKRQAKENGKGTKRKWEPKIYVTRTKAYAIFYLICRRLHHSISGVY